MNSTELQLGISKLRQKRNNCAAFLATFQVLHSKLRARIAFLLSSVKDDMNIEFVKKVGQCFSKTLTFEHLEANQFPAECYCIIKP